MDIQTSNKAKKHFKLECKKCVKRNRFKMQGFRLGRLDETFRIKTRKKNQINLLLSQCFIMISLSQKHFLNRID